MGYTRVVSFGLAWAFPDPLRLLLVHRAALDIFQPTPAAEDGNS